MQDHRVERVMDRPRLPLGCTRPHSADLVRDLAPDPRRAAGRRVPSAVVGTVRIWCDISRGTCSVRIWCGSAGRGAAAWTDVVVALLAVLVAGIVCGVQLFQLQLPPGTDPSPGELVRPPPIATAVAVLVIGTVSLVQLTGAPSLLGDLQRDRAAIADGEVWRLLTALTTQDGGAAGAISNLVLLAVLGTLAERVLGGPRAVAGWWAGALGGELVGLAWQPVGAGNSVGNLGLVGALAVAALATVIARRRTVPLLVALVVVLVGGAALLVGRDIHGAALATSLVVSGGIAAAGWWDPAARRFAGPAPRA
jgi:rhomboid protease GluP